MTELSTPADKATFRTRARALRRDIVRAAGDDAPARLADVFMDALDAFGLVSGATIAAFWPLADEVNLCPLMVALDQRGFRVALPVVMAPDTPLLFRRWQTGMTLEAGPLGTCHPPADAETMVPDLVLVPLLAFDRRGYRIGYGGGFYDRTLDALRRTGNVIAVGVAFAGQEVPVVPTDEYDQPLDWMLCETGLIRITVSD